MGGWGRLVLVYLWKSGDRTCKLAGYTAPLWLLGPIIELPKDRLRLRRLGAQRVFSQTPSMSDLSLSFNQYRGAVFFLLLETELALLLYTSSCIYIQLRRCKSSGEPIKVGSLATYTIKSKNSSNQIFFYLTWAHKLSFHLMICY